MNSMSPYVRFCRITTKVLVVLFSMFVLSFSSYSTANGQEIPNCKQTIDTEGLRGHSFLHIDPYEDCFINDRAPLTSYTLLLQNVGTEHCVATMQGGYFSKATGWVWSKTPGMYRFTPGQTREVNYDFTETSPTIAVGDIAVLHSGFGLATACDGQLEVRRTNNVKQLGEKGTYHNTSTMDAWFKIYSGDLSAYITPDPEELPIETPATTTYVRTPLPWWHSNDMGIQYEFFTNVPFVEEQLTAEESMLRQYHFQYFVTHLDQWATKIPIRSEDVLGRYTTCRHGLETCVGDMGMFPYKFKDGHYRVQARHMFGNEGWGAWSPWREFHVGEVPCWMEPDKNWFKRNWCAVTTYFSKQ